MVKIAIQMDNVNYLNYKSDSSYMIIEEAFKRGHELFFYYPETLFFGLGEVKANCYKVESLDNTKLMPITYKDCYSQNLEQFDIIFIRQDPPFDMAYITTTFLLEKLMDKVKIINNPISVRNSPEKLLVTEFYQYMPDTIITRSKQDIDNFINKHKKVIIKPLYGHGGSDVFLLDSESFNTPAILSYFSKNYKESFMVQQFLPNIQNGDKRVLMIGGEPLGCFSRVPMQGEVRSNMIVGASAKASSLSKQEELVCNALAPKLKDLGLYIVGLDFIDNYLIEINVTSPTGFRVLQNLEGINLIEKMFIKLGI